MRFSPAPIVFRCDRSPAVGAGHLTRCRSLALALGRRGVPSRFVLGEDSGAAVPGLVRDGFGVDLVPAAGAGPLPLIDLQETLTGASEYGAACVVVDHYGAGPEYLTGLAAAGFLVGAVDDLADRDLSAAAWILNQSLDALPADYPGGRWLALGTGFALLRPQFAEVRAGLERTFSREREFGPCAGVFSRERNISRAELHPVRGASASPATGRVRPP